MHGATPGRVVLGYTRKVAECEPEEQASKQRSFRVSASVPALASR